MMKCWLTKMLNAVNRVCLLSQGRIQHRGGVGSSPRYRRSDHGAPPKPPLQICTYSSLEGETRDERLWDKPLLTYLLDLSLFWASWILMLYLWSTKYTHACLFFNTLEKSRMGTGLPEIGGVRLVINQSVVPVEWSLHLKTRVVFPLFAIKVISFILSTLYIKHYHLILPLIVAICEIWLPRLTYGMYLVLLLKPGVTVPK
jgi:hypothetical protein